MKKLTYWANENKLLSQILIAIGHVSIALLSIQMGVLLLLIGIKIPEWIMFVLFELSVVAIWVYPSKKDFITSKQFYIKRKYFDFALLTLGALLTLVGANNLTSSALALEKAPIKESYINTSPKQVVLTSYSVEDAKHHQKTNYISASKKHDIKLTWLQKRLLKKFHASGARELDNLELTLLMILIILGVLLLETLIASLACNLACNNMGAAAVAVSIGGLAGLSALVSMAFRSMYPNMSKTNRILLAILIVLAPPAILFLFSSLNG